MRTHWPVSTETDTWRHIPFSTQPQHAQVERFAGDTRTTLQYIQPSNLQTTRIIDTQQPSKQPDSKPNGSSLVRQRKNLALCPNGQGRTRPCSPPNPTRTMLLRKPREHIDRCRQRHPNLILRRIGRSEKKVRSNLVCSIARRLHFGCFSMVSFVSLAMRGG